MNDFLAAVSMVSDPAAIVALLGGTLAGIVIGAMPGLSVNMGIALLFPLAFTVKGMGGIIMLLGIYCGAIYGGSISAILLKTPGTPASAATTLDGYPMAMKYKQPGRALAFPRQAACLAASFPPFVCSSSLHSSRRSRCSSQSRNISHWQSSV